MAYQDIPTGATPGAGAGSGEVLVTAADTTGGFLNDELTTTAADITKTVVNGGGNESLNLSLPTGIARIANWSASLVRYFILDYDAGSDSNVGYIDAAAGTVHTALAVAAVAIKTFTKLFTLIPLIGNNRDFVVLMKPRASGATYLDSDGVTESVCDWSNLSGYRTILRRASTDLTNSVTDRSLCGYITALAGPGAGGEFTCLAGATTTSFSVTGTPFTAEPGIIGYRVRFTGNVTGALANAITTIQINTSSVITSSGTLGATPAVGDTFFIEKPGLSVAQWMDFSSSHARTAHVSNIANKAQIRDVGIMVKGSAIGSLAFSGSPREICGCEQDSTAAAIVFRLTDCEYASVSAAYLDETSTSRAVGAGVRCSATTYLFSRIYQLDCDVFVHARNGFTPTMDRIRFGNCFTASYFGSPLTMRSIGHSSPGTSLGFFMGSGTGGGANKTRVIGGLVLSSTNLAMRGIDITGCTAIGAIIGANSGNNGATLFLDNITGTSGNTTWGFDFTGTGWRACKFVLGTLAANTVAGTTAEIRMPNSAVATHAAFTRTNIVDINGNEWLGLAGHIVDTCVSVTNKSGSACAVGDIVRGNATSGQVVKAQGDAVANAKILGVMVTASADNAIGYMAVSGAPSINFDGTPTDGAIAYISVGTAGQATTTVPPLAGTNQKLRLGRVIDHSTTTGKVSFHPESLAVLADGLA